MFEDDPNLLAAHRRLVEAGVLRPLGHDELEVRRWMDLDLASRIEGNHHRQVEVSALGPEERAAWWIKASHEQEREHSPHAWDWVRPYWLLDQGEPVGTFALECKLVGRRLAGVSSLYVQPEHRRRGVGRRALTAAYDAVRESGVAGLRVEADWTWQPAVRFYTRLGLWLRNWKHALTFVMQADLPPHRVEIDGNRAHFLVQAQHGHSERWDVLLEAQPDGDRLRLAEHDYLTQKGTS
jgi:GNAT superfamily N-acetyltransferase